MCSEVNAVQSFDRELFLRLDFMGNWQASFFPIRAPPNFTFPSRTETVLLLVAQTKGNGELRVPGGDWEVDRPKIYAKLRLCLIDKCHRNRSTACQSEIFPWITKDSDKSEVGTLKSVTCHQGSSRNQFDSCVCSVQVCGLTGVWNFNVGNIPRAQVLFKGTGRPWRRRPHLRCT